MLARTLVTTALIGVIALASCSDDNAVSDDASTTANRSDERDPSSPAATTATPTTETASTSSSPATTISAPPSTTATVTPEPEPIRSGPYTVCQPGPHKTVRNLKPLVVPRQTIPAVRVGDQEIDGDIVAGFVIPEQVIPKQIVDTGCIVEYDAPAGCLGAVDISPFVIPRVTIPGVTIPAAELNGDTITDKVRIDPVVIASVRQPRVHIARVCQQKPPKGNDGYVWGVTRWGANRWGANRWGANRWGANRWGQYYRGDYVDTVHVETVHVETVHVETVHVPTRRLKGYAVRGADTTAVEEPNRKAYITPADVFFDTDQATLRPDAVDTLRTILAQLNHTPPDAPILVEGHTDYRNTEAYNQDLSERRARAVADWLVANGIEPSRLTTKGWGETAPVAPNKNPDGSNNEAGMAMNRRVVISVATD